MSNHFSADNLKFPGADRRLDPPDVFMFQSPDNPDKTVLIMDSNPTSAPPPIPAPTTGPEFHPDAVHRINIDTGSQAREAEPAGQQLVTSLPVSFDGEARAAQVGDIRIFAGLRSDPFFAD